MTDTLGPLTKDIAQHVASSKANHFKHTDFEYAKVALTDWIAVGLMGRNEELVDKLLLLTDDLGGNPQASIIGRGRKTDVAQAALINGAMSHALDYDDTSVVAMMHASTVLFPALTSLAEHRGLSAKAVLTSYLVGLHAAGWLAQVLGVAHYQMGWHGTATVGRTGAAAACSHLLGLNAQQNCYALGIAATQTGGFKESFGSMCKPYHAGLAARDGVLSALLAEKGFDSSEQALEGTLGLVNLYGGEGNPTDANYLGDAHPIEQLFFKFHAACHCCHGPIDIAQDLAEKQGIAAADIETVTLTCHQISADNAGKTELRTGLDGKFSMGYSFANALITGKTGMQGYTDEAVQNESVLDLMDRIAIEVDNPRAGSALNVIATVNLKDGSVIEQASDPIGTHFDLATKQAKVKAKFFDLCVPVLGRDKGEDLYQRIRDLDSQVPVAELLAATSVTTAAA